MNMVGLRFPCLVSISDSLPSKFSVYAMLSTGMMLYCRILVSLLNSHTLRPVELRNSIGLLIIHFFLVYVIYSVSSVLTYFFFVCSLAFIRQSNLSTELGWNNSDGFGHQTRIYLFRSFSHKRSS